MPSRWDTSEPNTALFRGALTGQVCRTDGFNFLHQLAADLYQRVGDAGGSLPGPDGVAVTSADVPDFAPDTVAQGSWSSPLLRAIYAAAQQARAPAAYMAALRTDLLTGAVSADTLRTAIWLVFHSHGDRNGVAANNLGSPAVVELPADTVLPVFGMSILRPATLSDITCAVGPLPVTPATPMQTIASVLPAPGWILLAGVTAAIVTVVVVSRNIPQQPRERRGR